MRMVQVFEFDSVDEFLAFTDANFFQYDPNVPMEINRGYWNEQASKQQIELIKDQMISFVNTNEESPFFDNGFVFVSKSEQSDELDMRLFIYRILTKSFFEKSQKERNITKEE